MGTTSYSLRSSSRFIAEDLSEKLELPRGLRLEKREAAAAAGVNRVDDADAVAQRQIDGDGKGIDGQVAVEVAQRLERLRAEAAGCAVVDGGGDAFAPQRHERRARRAARADY